MDHALVWIVEVAPKVLAWSATFLVGAILKHVVPILLNTVTRRWLKAAEEITALDNREKEEAAAAELFTAGARAMLEDANKRLAEDLRAANADIVRLARLANAYEQLARERSEDLARAESGMTPVERPPPSEPPAVVEEDARPTGRPPAVPVRRR